MAFSTEDFMKRMRKPQSLMTQLGGIGKQAFTGVGQRMAQVEQGVRGLSGLFAGGAYGALNGNPVTRSFGPTPARRRADMLATRRAGMGIGEFADNEGEGDDGQFPMPAIGVGGLWGGGPGPYNNNAMAQFLIGQSMMAPQRMAQQSNKFFADAASRNADYSNRIRTLETLSRLMGGLGGGMGGGGGLMGFRDPRTGQGVSFGGGGQQAMLQNNITAQAPGRAQILGATQGLAGAGGGNAPVSAGVPVSAAAGQQLGQQMRSLASAGLGAAATGLDRGMTDASSRLAQAIQIAQSQQGLGMGQYAVNASNDQTQRNSQLQQLILRRLLGGLA